MLETFLGAKEPFGLERFLLRKEEKMSPTVKASVLAAKLSVGLACVIWWVIFGLAWATYGLLGIVVHILWTIMIPVIVCGINHSHHKYDHKHEFDRRHDHR